MRPRFDGREGWATYFTRKNFPVYVVDHVGRGRSGFDPTPINQGAAGLTTSTTKPASAWGSCGYYRHHYCGHSRFYRRWW
jgi:hypothetical protein